VASLTGQRLHTDRKRQRSQWLAPLGSLALTVAIAAPATGQSMGALGVARASEVLIKKYDPKVKDVEVVVPAPPGTPTACEKDKKSKNGDWEAYYCRLDRKILVSQKNLDLIEKRFGYAAIATLMAHELAHGRQHALTGFSGDVVGSVVFDELQADCIAGVYMRRATPIELSQEQVMDAKKFLEAIGDYSFQERSWHGTPSMRSGAFDHGYKNGSLDACLASGQLNWKRILEDPSGSLDTVIEKGPKAVESLIDKGLKLLEGL
jgi:hypothetical protein